MTELCTICFDESHTITQKCENCTFECCSLCYTSINSEKCPICKSNKFNINFLYKQIENFKFEIQMYQQYIETMKNSHNIELDKLHRKQQIFYAYFFFISIAFIIIITIVTTIK